MWFAYLYRRGATASEWVPDPDEVAAATTEAECVTGILEPPWDATYELGVDPLPSQIADIRPHVVAPVPRLFARVDTADWTGQTYEYVGVQEDPTAPAPLPPNPLPREPLEGHSVHAVHLLPPVGTAGQLLTLDASQELSWLSPGTIALEDGSVTTAKLAANAVTADKINDGTITGAELAAGTITADKLAPGVIPAPPGPASDSTAGVIQLATTAEVQAGTGTIKAVTPGRLAGRTATEIRTGLVELATTAEAVAGTDTVRAVTPAGLEARIAALPTIPAASEATPGILSLATQVEVTTGTDDTKAITPLKLAGRLVNASETQRGLLELATTAEVTTGTNNLTAVTPLTLQQKLTAVLPGAASETTSGILMLASFNDVNTGIDHSKAVTPQGLAQRLAALPVASTGNAGLVELATSAETTTGTDTQRAVTPAGLAAKVPAGTPLSVARYAASGQALEASPNVVVDASGNLGVGTTTPTQRLHVQDGNVLVSNAAGSNIIVDGAAATLRFLAFHTNGITRWAILAQNDAESGGNSGSNFAIRRYDDAAGLLSNSLWIERATGNTGLVGVSTFGTGAVNVIGLRGGTAPTTSPVDTVQLWVADRGGAAGQAALHLRSEDGTTHVLGDLIGLGTTAPAALLHVVGNSTILERTTGDASGALLLFRKSRLGARLAAGDFATHLQFQGWVRNATDTADAWVTLGRIDARTDSMDAQGRAGGQMIFYTAPPVSATYAEVMRLTELGFVGINTGDPQSRLHITNENLTTGQLILGSQNVHVASGNVMGGVEFWSNDLGLTEPGMLSAYFRARAVSSHTGTDLGSELIWGLTPSGTATPVEAVRLSTLGSLIVGVSSGGSNLTRGIALGSGSGPTNSPTDVAQCWVEDFEGLAGAATWHFRAENGHLAKLGHGLITWLALQSSAAWTVAAPLVLTQEDSNKVLVASNTAEIAQFNLPDAAIGLTYTFLIYGASGLRIRAFAGETIRVGGTVGAAGAALQSTTLHGAITLVAVNSAAWLAMSVVGTWTHVA